jgi:hemerythrin
VAVFVWQDNYNLGIKLIDEQHRVLVRIINDLDDLLKNSFSREKLVALFSELVDYTKYHFSTEERLMKTRSYNSAQLSAHIRQHQQFVQQVKSLNEDSATYTREEAEWVLKYLTNWLINHILKVDRHLVDHLQRQEKEMLNPVKPTLETSLHLAESLYNEIGANLDSLREESFQPPAGFPDPEQTDLVGQVQTELEEVSALLKQALTHASLANKMFKLEKH